MTDRTALQSYLPAVRSFLQFPEAQPKRPSSWEEFDALLSSYLGFMCYVKDAHPVQGAFTVNGCVYLMPAISKHLQLSWKALQSWQKLHIGHDGGPVGLETLALMEEYLRSRSDDQSQVAADMQPVAVDGYMREQDLLQVQVRDIVDNPAEDCLSSSSGARYGASPERQDATKEFSWTTPTPEQWSGAASRTSSRRTRSSASPSRASDSSGKRRQTW